MLQRQFEDMNFDEMSDERLYKMLKKLNTIKAANFKEALENATKHRAKNGK